MSSTDPAPTPIRTSYIIATTVRTGSYLLCEALTATDVAGRPSETLGPRHRGAYCREWGLPEDVGFSDFLDNVKKKSTTRNGVFGIKIHGHHVVPIAQEFGFTGAPHGVLQALFPGARYIHLRRRDRRAQAISHHRAIMTNEWWRINGVINPHVNGQEAVFDAGKILYSERDLEVQDQAWLRYFADAKIEPLTMDYETLCADYRGEVARALAFLDQDPALASRLPEPRLVRQSDAITIEWRRRLDAAFPTSSNV